MPTQLPPGAQARLRKLVGVLGTNNENERLVALRAIETLLTAHGWRLHELLQAAGDPTLEPTLEPPRREPPREPPRPRTKYDTDPHNPFRSDAPPDSGDYSGDPHTRQMLDEMLDQPGPNQSINLFLASVDQQWSRKGRISERQREAVRACWHTWSDMRMGRRRGR